MARDIEDMSDLELIKELKKTIKTEGDINTDRLEFSVEDGQLIINGAVDSEEDLESLQQILSDYFGDSDEYYTDINVSDPEDGEYIKDKKNWEEDTDEDIDDDGLEEVEEGQGSDEDDFFNDDEEEF